MDHPRRTTNGWMVVRITFSFHPMQQLNIFPSKQHSSLLKRDSFFVSLGMKQTREECGRRSSAAGPSHFQRTEMLSKTLNSVYLNR